MICLCGGGGGEKYVLASRNKDWLVLGEGKKMLVLGKNSSSDVASVTQKCLVLSDYI